MRTKSGEEAVCEIMRVVIEKRERRIDEKRKDRGGGERTKDGRGYISLNVRGWARAAERERQARKARAWVEWSPIHLPVDIERRMKKEERSQRMLSLPQAEVATRATISVGPMMASCDPTSFLSPRFDPSSTFTGFLHAKMDGFRMSSLIKSNVNR